MADGCYLVEARQAGNLLLGEVVYNREALDRAELFAPGAFTSVADPLVLRLQHDRGRSPAATTADHTLTVEDTETSLKLEARLRPGSAEHQLVVRGALTGLSVEFVAREETRNSAGVRIISDAHLDGIGLVDMASYQFRVELRAKMRGAWFSATIPSGEEMACRCQGPSCDRVMFEAGSFDLGESTLGVGGGGFSNVLGSLNRKTLIAQETSKGLQIGLTDPNTETAQRIISDAAVADMFARPILDLEGSEYQDRDGLRVFTVARVRAILIKPTDTDQGHIPAEIEGIPLEARRRLWL